MDRTKQRAQRRIRRKRGLRKRIIGTPSRPRLTVFRSHRHIYAQVIDDLSGQTLVSAGTQDKEIPLEKGGGDVSAAGEVGKLLGDRAVKAGVTQVCFDRSGYRYHGRIKALAEASRKAGLKF